MKIPKTESRKPEETRTPKLEWVARRAPFEIWPACRLAFCVLASVLCLPAFAQSYGIEWYTIDGGGGTSTGGVYAVSGTIGQPDVSTSTMSGGEFSLQGGFWPGLVVPSSTGAPMLFIELSGGNVIISWLPVTSDFVLEEATSLVSPSWSSGPSGNPTAPIPVTGEAKFYRLHRP